MTTGTDVLIPCHAHAFRAAIAAVFAHWPQAVTEDMGADGSREVFVCRNDAAKRAWDGGSFGIKGDAIMLIWSAGELTLVCDDPDDAETARIIRSVREAVA